MKKILFFGMIGALALTFNACSSEDELANDQQLDQKDVKTRFALSLTNDVKTRMQADLAQVSEEFQGMTGIQLFPFSAAVNAQSQIENNPIHLADFTTFDATNVNAKVYTDVTIPVGTTDFLFYGKIADNGGEGELVASYDVNTLQLGQPVNEAIKFDLKPIVEEASFEGGKSIIDGLNAVYAAIPETDAWADTRAAFESLQAGSWCSVAAFMEDFFESVTGSDAEEAIQDAIVAAGFTDADGKAVVKEDGFPRDLNLPDGAVKVAFDNGAFAYVDGSFDGMEVPTMDVYTKPAELYYTVNTKAVIDETETHADKFNNYNAWDAVIAGEYSGNVGAVTATTKSVVLQDQVQYGVGRLDAKVKVTENTVKDSKDNYVSVPADGYTVTGILIGGQKQVGWNFETNGAAPEFTIYDPNVEGAAVVGEDSETMYTLALETAKDAVINIALEFVNTGEDFYGNNQQIIPAGTKFYLVAQLDPKKAKNYVENVLDKVFIQDHATRLSLTIDEDALENAYNVVPDLRSPKLEFGLSVNLEWLEGLEFEQNF
jgi:hypothetical protein